MRACRAPSTHQVYDPEAEADCISQESSSAWSARDPSLSRVMLWHCSRVTQSWLRSCLGTRMRPSPHNPQIRTKLKCFLRHWEKRGFWGSREHLHTMHHWYSDALLASRFPIVHWCFHFIVQDLLSPRIPNLLWSSGKGQAWIGKVWSLKGP